MAFYDEEEDNELDPSAPSQPSGQSGIITGQGSAPGAGSGPTAKPDNPGNFVGLKTYLDANKVQSSKLGDQVSGQIAGSIQDATSQIGQVGSKFNEQVDAGTIKNLGTAVDDTKGITNQAATQAFGQGLTGDQTNRFKEVTTAQYKGPKELIETDLYQPVYGKVKEAQNYANLSKDEAGNQQLLRDMYKTPSYSAGENRFDSYLLNSEENKQKLAQSRQNAENLQGNLDAAGLSAKEYADKIAADTEAAKIAARQYLEGTQTQRNVDVETGLEAQKSGWTDEYNQYLNLLNNSDQGNNLVLNDEQMKTLGVNADQRIFNLLNGSNAADYLTQQEFDPNKVISKDEQAQLAALDQLASLYGGEQQNKYNQADLAGTLNKDIAFAADKFGLAAKDQQTMFDAASKIANMTASLDKSSPLYEDQISQVTREITKYLPWPLDKIVKEIVTDTISSNVKVGSVDTTSTASGTVADYLAGQGPVIDNKGTKSLDWGSILSPTSVISSQADKKIDELYNQANTENKTNWTNQILSYLQDAGYNKQIKSQTAQQAAELARQEEARKAKTSAPNKDAQGRTIYTKAGR